MKIYLFLKVVIYLAAISYSISNTKRVYEYNLYVLKENIVERVKYINELVKTVHPTLEKMCSNYLANRDPLLPIPLYEIFNSEMAKNLEQLQRESQSIIEERGQALITQRLAEEQIPHKEATLVESLSSYLTWSTTSVPESVASGLTVREIDGIRDLHLEAGNHQNFLG
jgi:hypothetical protein